MTKIYEALERAEAEKVEPGAEPRAAMQPPAVSPYPAKPIDASMVALYQGIQNATPGASSRAVMLVGATRSSDASVLAARFVQVVADRLGKKVLYVGVNHSANNGLLALLNGSCRLIDAADTTADLAAAVERVHDSSLFVASLSGGSEETTAHANTPEFAALLERLKARFDLIVFDPPSVDAAPDAFALAGRCDGVVLVVEAERTRWQVADAVCERLVEQGAKVLGAVLNKRRFRIPGFIYRRL